MEKKSWKNLITEDQFWEIIETSLLNTNYSLKTQYSQLEQVLKTKSLDEVIGFYYHSIELYRKAYSPELWAAPYIARNGCGDDSFHYFRYWLLTRGKKVYYDALKDPDSLISEFEHYEYRNDIQAESLSSIANELYAEITGEKFYLSSVIESEYEEKFDTKDEMELSMNIKFNWHENNEKSMKTICPKIFERFWKKPLKER